MERSGLCHFKALNVLSPNTAGLRELCRQVYIYIERGRERERERERERDFFLSSHWAFCLFFQDYKDIGIWDLLQPYDLLNTFLLHLFRKKIPKIKL